MEVSSDSTINLTEDIETYEIPDSPVNVDHLIDKDLEEEEKLYQSINEELDKQIAKDNEAIKNYVNRCTEDTPTKRMRYFNKIDNSHINNCFNKQHIVKQHTVNGTIKWHMCSICDYKTQETVKLTLHNTRSHSGFNAASKSDDFKCDKCSVKMKKYYDLLRHKKESHNTVTFSCEKCDFICVEESDLKEHVANEHIRLNFCWFKCGQCAYRTARKENLDKHFKHKHTIF